jgi:hypothetical protein
MAETQTLVLGILVVVIAVGVLYLVDPTLGGALPAVKRMLGVEGFESQEEDEENKMTPGANPTNGLASMGTGDGLASAVQQAAQVIGGNTTSGLPSTSGAMVGNSMLPSVPSAPAVPSGGSASPSTVPTAEGFMNLNPSPMPFPGGEPPSDCYPTNQLRPQELLPRDPNSKWAAVNPMGSGDISGKNFLSAGALIGVNTVGQSLRNANHDLRSDPPNPQIVVSPWNQTNISPDLMRRPLE